jgi:uncharacterized Zn-binding protein involved in type VI secretion
MAARIGDYHSCPVTEPKPHIGGNINGGSPNVITGGQAQSRVGDAAICIGGPLDKIRKGSDTVFVNGKMAARKDDPTDKGKIEAGCATVFIGDSGGGGSGGSDLANASNNATPMLPLPPAPAPTAGSLANDNIVTQVPSSTDASAGAAAGQAASAPTTGADGVTTTNAPPAQTAPGQIVPLI